jgi:hypothetical protein
VLKLSTAQVYFNNRYDLFTKADASADIFAKDSSYFVSCGGLDVTQSNLSLSVIKLNKFGVIDKSKHYFKNNNWFYTGLGNSTCQLSDSVLISTGYRVGSGTSKSFILWYKNNLYSVKYLEYGFANKENVVYNILNDNIGHLYQVGYLDSNYTNSDILLIKTDTSGNEIWKKKIGSPGFDEYGWCIKMASDNKLLISGNKRVHSNQSINGAYILKADTNGTVIWEQYFPSNNGVAATSLVELPNTDIVAVAGQGYGGTTRMELIKLDSAGNLLFDRVYGLTTDHIAPYSLLLNNHNYLVAAAQNYYPSAGGKVNGVMYEFNQNGDSLFSREYAIQPGSQNYFRDIVQAPDHGYVFSGFISPLFANGGTGNQDIWLLKTDSTFCESAISCGYPTSVTTDQQVISSQGITLFPNPVQHILNLKFEESIPEHSAITFTDLLGKTIMEYPLQLNGNNEAILDLSILPNGMYCYRIELKDMAPITGKVTVLK